MRYCICLCTFDIKRKFNSHNNCFLLPPIPCAHKRRPPTQTNKTRFHQPHTQPNTRKHAGRVDAVSAGCDFRPLVLRNLQLFALLFGRRARRVHGGASDARGGPARRGAGARARRHLRRQRRLHLAGARGAVACLPAAGDSARARCARARCGGRADARSRRGAALRGALAQHCNCVAAGARARRRHGRRARRHRHVQGAHFADQVRAAGHAPPAAAERRALQRRNDGDGLGGRRLFAAPAAARRLRARARRRAARQPAQAHAQPRLDLVQRRLSPPAPCALPKWPARAAPAARLRG